MAKQQSAKTQINCRFDEEIIAEIDRRRGGKNRSAFCQQLISNAMADTPQSTNTSASELSHLGEMFSDFEDRLIAFLDPITSDIPVIVQNTADARDAAQSAAKNAHLLHGEIATAISTVLLTIGKEKKPDVEEFITEAFRGVESDP